MVWCGMVGHADPPTPQIWAANMCHIHGGVYTTNEEMKSREACSKCNLKVALIWLDQTFISQSVPKYASKYSQIFGTNYSCEYLDRFQKPSISLVAVR